MTTSPCWSVLVKIMRQTTTKMSPCWQNNKSLGCAGLVWSELQSAMQREIRHGKEGSNDPLVRRIVVHFYVLGVSTVLLP